MNRQSRYNIFNAVGLNLVWMAAVAGAAAGYWWAGPLAAAVFFAGHLPYFTHTDALVLTVLMPLGVVLDSLYAATGVVIYAAPMPWPGLAPIWILALWFAFALTVGHSLRLLLSRLWLAAVLGAIFGPLSYWIAADVWGAAQFGAGPAVWIPALAFPWALVMALCHRLLAMETELGDSPAATAVASFLTLNRR